MSEGNQKSESAKYWEEHLLSWEASAYFKDTEHKPNLWDGLSTLFRGEAMYIRMNKALELLEPHLPGMSVLDIGCASGRFAFHLVEAGAAKVYGVDISDEAIEMAKARSVQLNVEERTEFSVADVIHPASPLPDADLVTALGVIEYFDPETMSAFLGNLRTRYFLLDFPDHGRKKEFPSWLLRKVYIRVNRLPGVYFYHPQDFIELAEPFGFKDIWVAKRERFYYITNLPKP